MSYFYTYLGAGSVIDDTASEAETHQDLLHFTGTLMLLAYGQMSAPLEHKGHFPLSLENQFANSITPGPTSGEHNNHWSSVFDQFPDLFLLYPAPFSLWRRV